MELLVLSVYSFVVAVVLVWVVKLLRKAFRRRG